MAAPPTGGGSPFNKKFPPPGVPPDAPSIPGPSQVSPYVGNWGSGQGNAATFHIAPQAQAGNGLVIFINTNGGSLTTLKGSDQFGSVYITPNFVTSSNNLYWLYCPLLLGSNPNVTLTCSGSPGSEVIWFPIVGQNPNFFLDGWAWQTGSAHILNTGLVTLEPNCLVVAAGTYSSSNTTNTWTSPYRHGTVAGGVSNLDAAWSPAPLASGAAGPQVTWGGGTLGSTLIVVSIRTLPQYPSQQTPRGLPLLPPGVRVPIIPFPGLSVTPVAATTVAPVVVTLPQDYRDSQPTLSRPLLSGVASPQFFAPQQQYQDVAPQVNRTAPMPQGPVVTTRFTPQQDYQDVAPRVNRTAPMPQGPVVSLQWAAPLEAIQPQTSVWPSVFHATAVATQVASFIAVAPQTQDAAGATLTKPLVGPPLITQFVVPPQPDTTQPQGQINRTAPMGQGPVVTTSFTPQQSYTDVAPVVSKPTPNVQGKVPPLVQGAPVNDLTPPSWVIRPTPNVQGPVPPLVQGAPVYDLTPPSWVIRPTPNTQGPVPPLVSGAPAWDLTQQAWISRPTPNVQGPVPPLQTAAPAWDLTLKAVITPTAISVPPPTGPVPALQLAAPQDPTQPGARLNAPTTQATSQVSSFLLASPQVEDRATGKLFSPLVGSNVIRQFVIQPQIWDSAAAYIFRPTPNVQGKVPPLVWAAPVHDLTLKALINAPFKNPAGTITNISGLAVSHSVVHQVTPVKIHKLIFQLVSPQWLTLQQWADAFVYVNTPIVIFPRLMEEKDFNRWAAEVISNAVLTGLVLPQPIEDWRTWAYELNNVLSIAATQ